jgi:branched-chain amino acid aminotransferase
LGRLVLIDGVVCAPEEARVSVYDRGFLYGDSVFETIRTYGGKPFALDEHIHRLERSAGEVGIALPVPADQIAEETLRAVTEAGNPESYARLMLTRGSGKLGLDPSHADQPLRIVIIEPLKMPPKEIYQRGIRARSIQTVRAADAANSAKLGNYLASVLALREAQAGGADEALVVNRDGLVIEGTTANVMSVRAGRVVTPPLTAGVLAGITRARVLDIARELGFEVDEEAFTPTELARSDELFLTSSIREIVPVVMLDGMPIGNGEPGAVTRALHAAFRRRVGLAELPWI